MSSTKRLTSSVEDRRSSFCLARAAVAAAAAAAVLVLGIAFRAACFALSAFNLAFFSAKAAARVSREVMTLGLQ